MKLSPLQQAVDIVFILLHNEEKPSAVQIRDAVGKAWSLLPEGSYRWEIVNELKSIAVRNELAGGWSDL